MRRRSYLPALSAWKMVYEDAVSMVLLPKSRLLPNYIYPEYPNNELLRDDFSRHVDLSRLLRLWERLLAPPWLSATQRRLTGDQLRETGPAQNSSRLQRSAPDS